MRNIKHIWKCPYYPKHTRKHAHTRAPGKVNSMAVAPYCTKERSCLDLLRLHLLDEPSPAHTGSHWQDTNHLPPPLSHSLSLSFSFCLSTLSLPPFSSSCPSCCCSQRPFRAYLTKQHTTHAAYLSPPCSLPLSLCEKTEILNLAAGAMSHDLATPFPPSLLTLSLTPPLHSLKPIIPQPFADNRHMHACPMKLSCTGGGAQKKQLRKWKVLSQLPHPMSSLQYINACMVRARGWRGHVKYIRKSTEWKKSTTSSDPCKNLQQEGK